MTDTPSHDEIVDRIVAILTSRRTGQEVADYLERQTADQSRRSAVADLRARRLDHRVAVACSVG